MSVTLSAWSASVSPFYLVFVPTYPNLNKEVYIDFLAQFGKSLFLDIFKAFDETLKTRQGFFEVRDTKNINIFLWGKNLYYNNNYSHSFESLSKYSRWTHTHTHKLTHTHTIHTLTHCSIRCWFGALVVNTNQLRTKENNSFVFSLTVNSCACMMTFG